MKKYPLREVLSLIQNTLRFLEESVEVYPHRIVSADEHINLIYRRLPDLSMRIGSVLGQETGPCRLIPVLAEENIFTLTAFMGAVRAGCSYVFLDAGQLAERLNRILNTLQVDLMIIDRENLSLAGPVSLSGGILPLEDSVSLPDDAPNPGLLTFIRRQSTGMNPLYGVFIFDSTGIPKGMVTDHRSAIDFIGHSADLFHMTQDDIIGSQVPFDFDVSVRDIYSALKTGATPEVTPKELSPIPTGLLDYLCGREIITTTWVASALCIITTLKGFIYRISSHLNKILPSGGAMPVKHLDTWRSCLPKALSVDLYGPMEITRNCTYYVADRKFESGTPIPIGRPFPNEIVFLLDESSRLITGPGQNGELCVAGTTLALGHYGDLRYAVMASVQGPLNSCHSKTIYGTGDLAYHGRGGSLYFNGRKGSQIKHMGHRIELDEIKTAPETMEGVDKVVCLLLEEEDKIAAFYEGTAVRRNIAIGLESLLPHCTFPNSYRSLTELPRTENGKVD